jgi:UDP-N-acetylglucosamine 4,6-dehydratase
MISAEDAYRTLQFEDHYVVQPVISEWGGEPIEEGKPVAEGFVYRSDLNDRWLSPDELRDMIAHPN